MTSTALSRHEINLMDRKSLTKILELTGKTLITYLKEKAAVAAIKERELLFETATSLVAKYPQYLMDTSAKLDQFTAKYGFDQKMREEADILLAAQSILQRVDFNQLER